MVEGNYFVIVYTRSKPYGEHLPDVQATSYESAEYHGMCEALRVFGSADIIRVEVGTR